MPEWLGPWLPLAQAGFVLGWVIGGTLAAVLFIWKLFGGLLRNGNGNGVDKLEKRIERLENLFLRAKDDD